MKKNKALAYALIISVLIHAVFIVFLVLHRQSHKKKRHKYTRPILVEPYKFMKNLKKHEIKKPELASIKPHYAKQNTRLSAPYSSGSPYRPPVANTPPAPYNNNFAHPDNNAITRTPSYRRTFSSSHLISRNYSEERRQQNFNINNPYSMDSYFNESKNGIKGNGPRNPEKGVKSATVNLNTTTIKYASYLLNVKNKIEDVWEYPGQARENGISGVLVIEFSINKDGSLHSVSVLRSSGKKILDKAAVKAIYDAARYNPFPRYWTINRLNIIGTFIYRLSGFYMY